MHILLYLARLIEFVAGLSSFLIGLVITWEASAVARQRTFTSRWKQFVLGLLLIILGLAVLATSLP